MNRVWWATKSVKLLKKHNKFFFIDGYKYDFESYNILMNYIRQLKVGYPFFNIYTYKWTKIKSFDHVWGPINRRRFFWGDKYKSVGKYVELPVIFTEDNYIFYDVDFWLIADLRDEYQSLDEKLGEFNALLGKSPEWLGPWHERGVKINPISQASINLYDSLLDVDISE